MTNYLLSMHYGEETPSDEELEPVMKQVEAFNEELRAQGAWVFTAGLEPASTATVVRLQSGEAVTTDGPYLETKEHLGGFWVIRADDLDAALGWATKATEALGGGLAIEVRPVAHGSCG
jgi:hypothetical protein